MFCCLTAANCRSWGQTFASRYRFSGRYFGTKARCSHVDFVTYQRPQTSTFYASAIWSGRAKSFSFILWRSSCSQNQWSGYPIFSRWTNQRGLLLKSNAVVFKLSFQLGFPESYPSDLHCVWTLKAPPGYKVVGQFVEFDLTDSDDCSSDYVQIEGMCTKYKKTQ